MKMWELPPCKISGHLIPLSICLVTWFVTVTATPRQVVGSPVDTAEICLREGDSLLFHANYDKAQTKYETAAAKFLAGGNYNGYVMALNRITSLWIEKDIWQPAIKCSETASDTASKHLSTSDPERICTIINKGRIKSEKGYSEEAMCLFREAVSLLKKAGLSGHHYAAVVYNCLAQEYDHNWDFSRAICYYHMALDIDRKLYPESHPVIARHLAELGESCIYNGEPEEALRNIRKSLRIHLRYFGENHPWTGKAYGDLANYYFYAREKDSVMFYSEKALKVLSSLVQKNHLFNSIIHQRIAYQYELRGPADSAIAHMKESIKILESRDILSHRRLAWAYIWMHKIYSRADLVAFKADSAGARIYLDSAYHCIYKGIQAIKPGYNDTSRFACPDTSNLIFDRYIINLMTNKTILLYKSYLAYHDNRYYKSYLNCMEALYSIYQKHISQRSIRKAREEITEEICSRLDFAVYVAIELYQSTGEKKYLGEAFRLSEENKSYLLASLLARSEEENLENIEDPGAIAEVSLRTRIKKLESEIYHQIYENQRADSVGLSSLYVKLCQTVEENDSLIIIANKQEISSKRKKELNSVVSLDDTRNALGDSTAMVVYNFNEFASQGIMQIKTFYLTNDTVLVGISGLTEQFYDAIENYRNFLIQDSDGTETGKETFVNAAVFLYKALIEPGKDVIQDKNLIIVPHDILCHIPFEAFLTGAPGPETSFNKMPWLIRDRTVSYTHSATVHFNSLNKSREGDNRYALFAMAPATTKDWKDDKLVAEWVARGEDLGQLTESRNEVEAVGKLFRGLVYTGLQATEREFKQKAGNYDIIHIATHGIVDDAFPMNSKLVLAKDKNGEEDGYLNVYELYAMELHAELAVLSACNTGYGKLQRGEGVISLARGFAYAGVPSVVMSLWKVKDRSTSILMQNFYTYLKKGYPKDRALQLAKLDYLDASDPFFSHPHFWAGFVHIGDQRALVLGNRRNNTWWLWLIPAMVLLSGYFIYRLKRQSFKTDPED